MKIQLLSDLHLEFDNKNTLFKPKFLGEDVLVLAGDIQVGLYMVDWFAQLLEYRDVVYVVGNHEFYDNELDTLYRDLPGFEFSVNSEAERLGYKYRLITLQNQSTVLNNVRFVGGTLWTDFNKNDPIVKLNAQRQMNDYHVIRKFDVKIRKLQPYDIYEEHVLTRQFIESELANAKEEKVVVVTHHAPSSLSIHPDYAGNYMNPMFYTDMTYLMDKCDLWFHGHVHNNFDYTIDRCRVVCNPRGYVGHALNPNFNEELIEI